MRAEVAKLRRQMVVLFAIVMLFCTLAVIRTSTVTDANRRSIERLELVEADLQALIDQGKLTCPDRAIARDIIRTSILEDPDTTEGLRALVQTDFPEITCDKP